MLSRVLSHLVEQGYARRLVDANDRRSASVVATAAGRKQMARVRRVRDDFLETIVGNLAFEEQQALKAALPVLETLVELARD